MAAQADLSLRWAHSHFVGFVMSRLISNQINFRYTLKNKNNVEVKILNYGGIITNIFAPDKNNNREDIVLGFDTFEGTMGKTEFQKSGNTHTAGWSFAKYTKRSVLLPSEP